MLIYLFKGNDGKVIGTNELTAHNWLRNRTAWQRQDLVYLGATDDSEVAKAHETVKERARDAVFATLPNSQLLQDEISLAEMQKDDEKKKMKELELRILRGVFDSTIADRSGTIVSDEHDKWRALVIKKNNEFMEETLQTLVPDLSKKPRDFSKVTSNFSGEDVQIMNDITL